MRYGLLAANYDLTDVVALCPLREAKQLPGRILIVQAKT